MKELLTVKEIESILKQVLNKDEVSVTYSYKGKASDYSKDKVQIHIQER